MSCGTRAAIARSLAAQGAEPDYVLPTARERQLIVAPNSGVVSRLDALAVGLASWRLGAGRARKEDAVQAAAGIRCLTKPGDRVAAGQPIFELHTDTPERFAAASADLDGAIDIGQAASVPMTRSPLVIDVIRD